MVQITEGGSPWLTDVSVDGELLVAGIEIETERSPADCGLWLLNLQTGQVIKIAEGLVSYPWGALFSPVGGRAIYSATDECTLPIASGTAQSLNEGMWVLDLKTLETETIYDREPPVLLGWLSADSFLVTRPAPDGEGWTLWVEDRDGGSQVVHNLVMEYRGFNLFTDKLSPDGSLIYHHVETLQEVFSDQLSLTSLSSGEVTRESWQGWWWPGSRGQPWSPDSRLLLYHVAGSVRGDMPIDLMVLDVETGEHHLLLKDIGREGPLESLTWPPDSQVVLLLSDDGTTLYALNADGSDLTEVTSSTLTGTLSSYVNLHWSMDCGYLFFHRVQPPPQYDYLTEIWVGVVRRPGESDVDLQARLQQLQDGPWPVAISP